MYYGKSHAKVLGPAHQARKPRSPAETACRTGTETGEMAARRHLNSAKMAAAIEVCRGRLSSLVSCRMSRRSASACKTRDISARPSPLEVVAANAAIDIAHLPNDV
jgi:hypothetical protein